MIETEKGRLALSLKRENISAVRGVLGQLDPQLLRAYVVPSLDVSTAANLSCVCHSWYRAVNSASTYWRDRCVSFASCCSFVKTAPGYGQRGEPPRTLKLYVASEHSNRDLRRMLYIAGISHAGLVEKSDFVARVCTHLMLEDDRAPHWTKTMNDWKATYFFLKRDMRRTHLTRHEAISLSWTVKFNDASHLGTPREVFVAMNCPRDALCQAVTIILP